MKTVLLILIATSLWCKSYNFNNIREIAKNSYEYRKVIVDSLNYEIESNQLSYFYLPKIDLKLSETPYSENIIKDSVTTSTTSNSFSSILYFNEKIPYDFNLGASYRLGYSDASDVSSSKNSSATFNLSKSFYPFMEWNSEYRFMQFDKDDSFLAKRFSIINYQFSLLNNYYNYFKAQEQLKLTKKSFEQSKENFETGNRKYMVGLIPEVEKLEMELNFEEKKISYEEDLDRFEKQRTLFFDFIGFKGDSLEVSEELEINPPKFDLEKDLSKALEVDRTLLSKRREKLSASNEIGNFFKENLVSGSFGTSYSISSSELDLLADGRSEDINLSFSLTIPIISNFNYLKKYDKVKLQKRLTDQDYNNSVEKAKVDYRDMTKAIEFSYRKLLISIKSNQLAERIYEISKRRYEEGQITSKTFIDHQQSLEAKNLDLLRAKIDYTMQLNSYKKLLGEFLF